MNPTYQVFNNDQAYGEKTFFTAFKYEHVNEHSHPASKMKDTRVEFVWYFEGENGFDSPAMDVGGQFMVWKEDSYVEMYNLRYGAHSENDYSAWGKGSSTEVGRTIFLFFIITILIV